MSGPLPVTDDTTAILLLCGHFGAKRGAARPLTPAEFHTLARWLADRRLAPGDLLRFQLETIEGGPADKSLAPGRLKVLLHRHEDLISAKAQWSEAGIWVMSESDPDYPERLRGRVKSAAAPLLFGAGPRQALGAGGVCIVGSRNSALPGLHFARSLGSKCGEQGLTVISSDMRGVNREAVSGALEAGGHAICVVSDSLEKSVAAKRNRQALAEGSMTLITPFAPDTRFHVANAMRTNKYQYALSDVAVVVETRRHGGVWSGVDENRNEGWVPAFVRTGEHMAPGNTALLHLGLRPISQEQIDGCADLRELFLAGAASPPRSDTAGPTPPAVTDLYEVFVSDVRGWAEGDGATEADIVATFGLERSQARAWLKRAVDEGRLSKRGRPARYHAP